MRNVCRSFTTLVLAIALGYALPLAVAAYGEAPATGTVTEPGTQSVPLQKPFDLHFLDRMSDHHRQGIAMMDIAIDKARTESVEAMARKMRAGQIEDIAGMQEKKAEVALALNSGLAPAATPMDMAVLQNATGMEFDRAFLSMMIEHHKQAVGMAEDALAQAETEDVREIARKTRAQQEREIEDMRRMLEGM